MQASNLACTTDETKLWLYKSVCETAPESLFDGGPTCVLGFEYEQWLACEKSHCRFAYLEIQNALPVIRRVQVGSVWFRLFGISLNTAKMKYVI